MNDSFHDDVWLDPKLFFHRRLAVLEPEHEWSAATLEEAERWRSEVEPIVRERAGVPKEDPPPLDVRILDTRDFPAYRRETLLFRTREGLDAFAYFGAIDNCVGNG